MAKNRKKNEKPLTDPHTLNPNTGEPPAYATLVCIQGNQDPIAARAHARYLGSRGVQVKLAPHLHRRSESQARITAGSLQPSISLEVSLKGGNNKKPEGW